jgi:hypothetical protein
VLDTNHLVAIDLTRGLSCDHCARPSGVKGERS